MIDVQELWYTVLKDWAWQIENEFVTLLRFLQEKEVKTVLEIGCYDGGTARGFLGIGCSVISVDIERRERVLTLEEEFPKKFKFVEMSSQEFELKKKVDVLYIDGDHGYEEVKADFNRFKDNVKPGGFIVFHDILDSELHAKQGCGVPKFWKEIKEEGDIELIHGGESWGGIGIKIIPS